MTFYSDEATDFRNKETPKVGSNYTCLAVYPQVFLKEYKLIEKEKSN